MMIMIMMIPGAFGFFLPPQQRQALLTQFRRGEETYCQSSRRHPPHYDHPHPTTYIQCWNLERFQAKTITATTRLSNTLDPESGEGANLLTVPEGTNAALHNNHNNHNNNGFGASTTSARSHHNNNGQIGATMPEALEQLDVPMPTANGGYTHTLASKAKIGAANKGKVPWNKGRKRSEEVKARIAAGVRAKNRERFLEKLQEMGLTEDEYEAQKRQARREKDAERRARRTEKGGYRPTEETKAKISKILKEKHARGEIKRKKTDPAKVRRGFTHSEETRKKISESLKKRWEKDPAYRDRMKNSMKRTYSKEEIRKKVSDTLKKKWQDPDFRQQMVDKMQNRKTPQIDKAYREKISETMKEKWQDPEYRKKTLAGMHNSLQERAPKKTAPRKKKGSSVKGSELQGVRMMQPIATREPGKKKKKAVRKKKSPNVNVSGVNGSVDELPTVQTKAQTKAKKKKRKAKKKKSKEPDGSVNRLREERRDLFDLLYGDEPFEGDEDNDDENDDNASSLTSLFNLGDEDLDSFDPYGLDDY